MTKNTTQSASNLTLVDGKQLMMPFDGTDDKKPREPIYVKATADEAWISASEYSPVPTRITNSRAQVIHVNQLWQDCTKMPLAEAMALGWLNRVEETMRLPLLERLLVPAEEQSGPFTMDYLLLDHQGHGRPVREVAKPRFSKTGTFLGHVAIIMDLSNRTQMEREDETSTSFDPTLSAAAAMAYDIAPPLTAAIAYNHAVLSQLKSESGPSAAKAATQLALASRHLQKSSDLLRRLREVLTKGRAYFDTTDLNELVKGAVNEIAADCGTSGIQLIIDLPHEHAPVMADAMQVRKVLSYLLTNAIESVSGTVGAKISVQLDQDGQGFWRFCIRNNGALLREQDDEPVFSTLNPATHGVTGLGLAISQSIIRGHNGRLWHEAPAPTDRGSIWKGGALTFVLPPCRAS